MSDGIITDWFENKQNLLEMGDSMDGIGRVESGTETDHVIREVGSRVAPGIVSSCREPLQWLEYLFTHYH